MSLIKGIHHVSMKCESAEEYQKVISFYKEKHNKNLIIR